MTGLSSWADAINDGPSALWIPAQPVCLRWERFHLWVGARWPQGSQSIWEFAAYAAADPSRATRVAIPMDKKGIGMGGCLTPSAQALAVLGDGEFVGAILCEGKRISNVCRWKIAKDASPSSTVISAVVIIPREGEKVTHLGCWVTAPPGGDSQLTNYAAAIPIFLLHGKRRSQEAPPWAGPISPLIPGATHPEIYDMRVRRAGGFTPFEYNEGEDLRIEIAGYVSDPVKLTLDRADEQAFDRAFGLK